jgi:hypothetical protein
MTPADLARDNAISFECKKDQLRQNQSGDWKIAFTVQAIDMDKRLTMAMPGTRYMAVLVEVGSDELPVHQPEKENNKSAARNPATPRTEVPDKSLPSGAKLDWRELQPAAQCGIRCNDPVFWKFLEEQDGCPASNPDEAANIVRFLCGIESRSELGTNHKARVIWRQLDDQFQAWKLIDA